MFSDHRAEDLEYSEDRDVQWYVSSILGVWLELARQSHIHNVLPPDTLPTRYFLISSLYVHTAPLTCHQLWY